jgi:hypothetical protein
MELTLLVLIGGCAGLFGLASGFWIGDADNKQLKKAAAAEVREVEKRTQALLHEQERASAQKIRKLEQELNQLTTMLADLHELDRAARREPGRGEMKEGLRDRRENGMQANGPSLMQL